MPVVPVNRWLAIAALSSLAAIAPPVAARPVAAVHNRVVMQVSDNDTGKWNLALNNARNLQSDLGAQNVEIEIVAYGPGIAMPSTRSRPSASTASAAVTAESMPPESPNTTLRKPHLAA